MNFSPRKKAMDDFPSMGAKKRIEEVFVFLSEDQEGHNGLVGAGWPGVGGAPLLTFSKETAEQMKLMATAIAHNTGGVILMSSFKRQDDTWRTSDAPRNEFSRQDGPLDDHMGRRKRN